MQTLDLLSPAAHPDAWHEVRAPGGYEWWYFDAEDAASDTQIVAILLDGFVFHPGYLRRYAKYLRRPTKVAPPLPRDFPCAYFVVYEKGKIAAQFMTQFAAGSLHAARDRPEVRLGPNTFSITSGANSDTLSLSLSGTPWQLTARGPQTLVGQTLSAQITLDPISRHAPVERTFLSRAMTGANHSWVLANPHCTFSATVTLAGSPSPKTWHLAGRAYHDHNFGTGPLGPGLKRWIWGRALFDDACCTFHYAVPEDPDLPPEPHLLRIDPGGTVDLSPTDPRTVIADFSRRTPLALAYPDRLSFGPPLNLSQARLIDSSPFYLRLMYQATCDGRVGTAFCEVAYPHRLRWPVLGRMIEMSIHRPGT